MNLNYITARFRTKRELPPSRITAPDIDQLGGAHKLLSDQRSAYFRQSAMTTAGCVAPFTMTRSIP